MKRTRPVSKPARPQRWIKIDEMGTPRLLPLYNNQLTWPESKHRVGHRHDPCIQFEARRTCEINGFRVTVQLQPHHGDSYGYRFEKDGRV